MCSRELGGLAKAAPLPVKHPAEERRPGLHQLPFRYAGPGRLLPPEKFSQRIPRREQGPAVLPPQPRRLVQQGQQLPPWEIGSRPEGLLLRGQQHREGPAAGAGLGDTGCHIDRIHVRPLLPVHLDGEKGPVDRLCHRFVLKRFVRHDMAPVAGGVSNAQQHRLILPAGLFEGVRSPGPPVHGVFRVLEQVW